MCRYKKVLSRDVDIEDVQQLEELAALPEGLSTMKLLNMLVEIECCVRCKLHLRAGWMVQVCSSL